MKPEKRATLPAPLSPFCVKELSQTKFLLHWKELNWISIIFYVVLNVRFDYNIFFSRSLNIGKQARIAKILISFPTLLIKKTLRFNSRTVVNLNLSLVFMWGEKGAQFPNMFRIDFSYIYIFSGNSLQWLWERDFERDQEQRIKIVGVWFTALTRWDGALATHTWKAGCTTL